MNKEEFWKTIESVNHSVPDGNHEMVAKQMCEELLHYSPQDILDWHLILREYTNAAYRNDLWAACTALGAHSSDDGFIDFRTWLISQGKDIYMDAMRDPDTLAANPHAGNEMNFEAFSACAIDAYERKLNLTGMDRYTKPYPLWHFKEDFLKEIGGAAYEEYSRRYNEYMQSAGFGEAEDEVEDIASEGMVME